MLFRSEKEHPEVYAHLEDEEAVVFFWELLKRDVDKYEEYLKKITTQIVGSCSVVGTLNNLAKQRKLPYKSISIVDGDKKQDYIDCISLPGNKAPERLIFGDLKSIGWNRLDDRFGIGAGTLFQYLDDAMLLPDHHDWTTFVGNKTKRSKGTIWMIMVEEWCKQCLDNETAQQFIENIRNNL